MFPLRSVARIPALFLLFALFCPCLRAQDPPAPESPEAIKAAMVQHKSAIVLADSTKDIERAISLRMALAALSKLKDAQTLYEAAVQLADSADRTEDELAARKALARTLAVRGQMKQAYEEAMRLGDKSTEWMAQQAEVSGAKADALVQRSALERDSLSVLADAGRREAEIRINEANENAEFWMIVGAATIAVALIALVIVVLMNGRVLRRQRTEMEGLRADLNALAARSQNKVREQTSPTVVWPPSTVEPPSPPVVPLGPSVAQDPVLEAMFRKQAPERLATLRDARTRADHGKVQRVVHTLKPQLVNFDPAFAPLCARITDPAAPQGATWQADLDVLEAGIARILG